MPLYDTESESCLLCHHLVEDCGCQCNADITDDRPLLVVSEYEEVWEECNDPNCPDCKEE